MKLSLKRRQKDLEAIISRIFSFEGKRREVVCNPVVSSVTLSRDGRECKVGFICLNFSSNVSEERKNAAVKIVSRVFPSLIINNRYFHSLSLFRVPRFIFFYNNASGSSF